MSGFDSWGILHYYYIFLGRAEHVRFQETTENTKATKTFLYCDKHLFSLKEQGKFETTQRINFHVLLLLSTRQAMFCSSNLREVELPVDIVTWSLYKKISGFRNHGTEKTHII